jgi:aerobic-type carbon monoxide dehydrogenase small subunit (CoxS/CutS family)
MFQEFSLQRMQIVPVRHALDCLNLVVFCLDRNPSPTETEARYWLAGNLCRCTGYDKVIRAVLDAAAELRAE